MVKLLSVIFEGEEVGRLAWDERRRLSYFTYNPEFINKGLNLFPLVAPVNGANALMPIWGEEGKIYQKLPAFVADSLPDAWGNQLFALWCQQNHLSSRDITPLDKLSFIGKRGMGALEFVPETSHTNPTGQVDIAALANLAERVFAEREAVCISPEESITMQSLLTVGTSAGGRQPKAIIAINKERGEIRSGQVPNLTAYDYYLLKFGNSKYSSAELEMTYYELATMAGVCMMPSELYAVEGNRHFITKRFDRDGHRKVHTQTLAALSPEADSYELLLAVCRKLRLPDVDCQEVFRRMVFNVLANNTDDHNKNFSFVMQADGSWRLSPAYDVTFIFDTGGFLPNEDHCMYIRAKLRNITREDILLFARDNGIRRPETIIRSVVEALKLFRTVATKHAVAEQWIGRVETGIVENLKAWGEWDGQPAETAMDIDGHAFRNVRVEQAHKGNFHLFAEVDGKERRFVIGKNKEEYAMMERLGIAQLTAEQLKAMAEKYFK